MLNKYLCVILSLMICIFNLCPVSADEDAVSISNRIINNDKNFEMDFSIDDMDYYPFIYSEKNTWENNNVIGPCECEEGYLYLKDLKTNTIRQLLNVKVNAVRDTNEKIFFISNNSIYSVDYLGTTLTKYYTGRSKLNDMYIKYLNGNIYFVEGDTISMINENSFKVTKYIKCSNLDTLHIKSDTEIVYTENGNHYLYNVSTNKKTIATSEAAINNLYISKVIDTNNEISMYSVVPNGQQQKDTNLQYVFSLYPSGSYFSNNKSACTHHSNFNNSNCSYYGNCNCKPYCGAIQCIGFAKYVSDKYSHKSSWNAVSGDIDETDVKFNTVANVQAYFSSINTGAYVLLAHDSEANNGQHFHALVFIKKINNGILTYECNLSSNCNVQLLERTYTEFIDTYSNDWGIYSVSHHFNGTCQQYDSSYHKKYCNSSGCGGYILEAHYATNNIGTSTCTKCGYTGVIEYNEGLTQGNY